MTIENISDVGCPNAIRVLERSTGDKLNLTKADIMQISRALSEEYIARIRAQAYEDAKTGSCKLEGYLSTLKKAQWDRCCSVAKNTKAVSETASSLNRNRWKSGRYALNVSGQSYTVIIRGRAEKVIANMQCENGESVASFRKKDGEWKTVSTNAEMQFRWKSDQIYLAAYRRAAAELDIEKKKTDSPSNFERKG